MPKKSYEFNGKIYEVEGDETLFSFLDSLHTSNTQLKEQIENTPDFSSQMTLWEKAKPYYQAANTEINYKAKPIEVMKKCLEGKYDIEGQDDKTIAYLFHKVLPVYKAEDTEEGQKKGNVDKTQTTPIKTSGKGMTSEQMSGKMAEKRSEKPTK